MSTSARKRLMRDFKKLQARVCCAESRVRAHARAALLRRWRTRVEACFPLGAFGSTARAAARHQRHADRVQHHVLASCHLWARRHAVGGWCAHACAARAQNVCVFVARASRVGVHADRAQGMTDWLAPRRAQARSNSRSRSRRTTLTRLRLCASSPRCSTPTVRASSGPSASFRGGRSDCGGRARGAVYADGGICLDILQNNWSPIYDVSAVLTSIQSLLCDPNPNSPANSEAARMYTECRRAKRCAATPGVA